MFNLKSINSKSNNKKIDFNKNNKTKKRALLIIAAFAVVGTAIVIRSFAATPDYSTPGRIIAAYGNTTNLTCTQTAVKGNGPYCKITTDPKAGAVFDSESAGDNVLTLTPNDTLKKVDIDPGLDSQFCFYLSGTGSINILGGMAGTQSSYAGSFSSTEFTTKCTPNINQKFPIIQITGKFKINRVTVFYMPGYGPMHSLAKDSFSFVGYTPSVPAGKIVKGCIGGYTGETFNAWGTASNTAPQKFYNYDCKSADYGGYLKSKAFKLPNGTFKMCVRLYSGEGSTTFNIFSGTGSVLGGFLTGFSTPSNNSASKSSVCSKEFDVTTEYSNEYFQGYIRANVPVGSNLNISEISIVQKY